MFIAKNYNGDKIFISRAIINNLNKLTCPLCGEEVFIKNGKQRSPHFSHKANAGQCITIPRDNDLSLWHKTWLSLFPPENVEVLIDNNGKKNIADVQRDNIILEFQRKHITEKEFTFRTKLYNSAGYHVIWIFSGNVEAKFVHYKKDDPEKDITDYSWDNSYLWLKNYFNKSLKFDIVIFGKHNLERLFKFKKAPRNTFKTNNFVRILDFKNNLWKGQCLDTKFFLSNIFDKKNDVNINKVWSYNSTDKLSNDVQEELNNI